MEGAASYSLLFGVLGNISRVYSSILENIVELAFADKTSFNHGGNREDYGVDKLHQSKMAFKTEGKLSNNCMDSFIYSKISIVLLPEIPFGSIVFPLG